MKKELKEEPKLINLTNHSLKISIDGGQTIVEIKNSGVVRAVFRDIAVGMVDVEGVEVPLYETKYSEVIGIDLIDPDDGNIYVVSKHTAMALELLYPSVYKNVYYPDDFLKDFKTKAIVFCRSFKRA